LRYTERMTDVSRFDDAGLALTKSPGGEDGLSAFDKNLLDMASNNKSLAEMEEETGVPALRIEQRVREILAARDWLTPLERRALLMDDFAVLRKFVMDMMEANREGITSFTAKGMEITIPADPRWAANMLKVLQQLDLMITRDAGQTSKTMNQIKKNQARLMVSAITLAFERFVFEVEKVYPDVDKDVFRGFMETALPAAMEYVDAKTS
jgi:hypothetical protein